MTRVLGVFMVLVALAVTATAEQATKKSVPAKAGTKVPPAGEPEAPPPDVDGSGEDVVARDEPPLAADPPDDDPPAPPPATPPAV